MDPIYSKGPAWEQHLLRLCIALLLIIIAGLGGAALWAHQQAKLQNELPPAAQSKQQVRLNIARTAPIAEPAPEIVEKPVAEPTDQTAQRAQPDAPAPTVATTDNAAPDVQPAAKAEAAPRPAATPAPEKPSPPPAAPHHLQLIVTDTQAQIDELLLLPQGLTLVTSATNERLTDYVTFARHLGHSVLLAFPVTEDDTHPLLMSPTLSDQENLARLAKLLEDQILIDGIKLYWHNPLAGREAFMRDALAMITAQGLRIVGSNGPLAAREANWTDKIDRADQVGETIAAIDQPDYGARDLAQSITLATALGPNGHDALADWVMIAQRNGWTMHPIKKFKQAEQHD